MCWKSCRRRETWIIAHYISLINYMSQKSSLELSLSLSLSRCHSIFRHTLSALFYTFCGHFHSEILCCFCYQRFLWLENMSWRIGRQSWEGKITANQPFASLSKRGPSTKIIRDEGSWFSRHSNIRPLPLLLLHSHWTCYSWLLELTVVSQSCDNVVGW